MPPNEESRSADPGKTLREWLDVISKAVIALVGVTLAYVAGSYQQKTSLVTLLSQRETAESSLRSSMMEHLIGPFVGSAQQDKPLDPGRAQVLLELLALNFHTHFELKPLFLKVDADLHRAKRQDGRDALQSVARRVVDRQIAMLRAARVEAGPGWTNRLFSLFAKAPAPAKEVNLFFAKTMMLQKSSTMLIEAAETEPPLVDDTKVKNINSARNPALFGSGGGQSVCSLSPDQAYALRVKVTSYDPVTRTAGVSWQVAKDARGCDRPGAEEAEPGTGDERSGWRPWRTASLSPYEFPLTDNAQLEVSRRFALNLYYARDSDLLQLKLVWFPEGYITERERPMNYYEVNRTIGVE